MRFQLVDDILSLEPGVSIHAVKTLGSDEELFQDHFPGFPVVPGVLLTEMMAQAAGKCLLAQDAERGRPMLAQIRGAAFRAWVRPDETIHLHASIKSARSEFAVAEARAEVNGRLVATADLMFAFQPATSFAAGWRDEVLDRFLRRSAEAVRGPVEGDSA